jgi:hypothetical protein
MNVDREQLLTVLKFELRFLELGGYRQAAESKWRPHFIFEDSPTCPKCVQGEALRTCQAVISRAACGLLSLVPTERRNNPIPCRHIVLNDNGDTIDSLYRYGTEQELESAIVGWLKKTIQALESELPVRSSANSEKRTRLTAAAAVC